MARVLKDSFKDAPLIDGNDRGYICILCHFSLQALLL